MRPPMAPQTRNAIISGYNKELSSTGRNSKSIPRRFQEDLPPSRNMSRRTQSAKTPISKQSNIRSATTKKHRPYSANDVTFEHHNIGQSPAEPSCQTTDYSHYGPSPIEGTKEFSIRQSAYRAQEIPMPNTLNVLRPWLTPVISTDCTGIDSSDCYIFLPSLLRVDDIESLPVVPPVASDPESELQYTSVIVPEEKPNRKTEGDGWTCKHSGRGQLRIYTSDGKLLHESHSGLRTVEIVRKEIQELEDLMNGKGSVDGSSMIVQYQAEISQLQQMVNQTLGRVEEIERRDAAVLEASTPADTFGLRAFYSHHDEVMSQIKKQHADCIQELARLEEDLMLKEDHSHFRQRREETL